MAITAAVEMPMKIEVGMRVSHKLTSWLGRVSGVDHVAGRDTLNIACDNGRELRGLDREEFFYAGGKAAQ